MGQLQDRVKDYTSNMPDTERIPYDEHGDNGLIFASSYLPEELLLVILFKLDPKSLATCELVCKTWKILIDGYVWRKKVEATFGEPFPTNIKLPWTTYYILCKKKPFKRNLLKNHSGEQGVQNNWRVLSEGGDKWKVENPPVGVPPLPRNKSVFEGKENCFATSYYSCTKTQMVDLEAEGLLPDVLDNLQPPIVVSEWYSCRWDCPAVYECSAQLLGANNEVLDSFRFRDSIEGEKQNQWLHVSHEFVNYGPGLRKVSFYHGGMDKLYWAGHFGSKMAGACVLVKVPPVQEDTSKDTDSLSLGDTE